MVIVCVTADLNGNYLHRILKNSIIKHKFDQIHKWLQIYTCRMNVCEGSDEVNPEFSESDSLMIPRFVLRMITLHASLFVDMWRMHLQMNAAVWSY